MNTLLFMGNIGTTEILIIGGLLLIIVLLFSNPRNTPTWTGLIISLLTGTIVIYLILCYFGILGEERKKES
jgi:hypothetical protein